MKSRCPRCFCLTAEQPDPCRTCPLLQAAGDKLDRHAKEQTDPDDPPACPTCGGLWNDCGCDYTKWSPARVAEELREGDVYALHKHCHDLTEEPLCVLWADGTWLVIQDVVGTPYTQLRETLTDYDELRLISRAPVKPLHKRVRLGSVVECEEYGSTRIVSGITAEQVDFEPEPPYNRAEYELVENFDAKWQLAPASQTDC